MNIGRTVFSQLLDLFPLKEFRAAVARYDGDKRVRRLSCFDQFLAMAFAQLTARDSLRDTVACLRAMGPRLYHAGFRGRAARSTLAEANERRDWRIFADTATVLSAQAQHLYADEPLGIDLVHTAYALDSTVITLAASLCPWARIAPGQAAVKMHTLLDLRGSVPAFVHLTDARTADIETVDLLPVQPGAYYIMDRAFVDFARLARIDAAGAFFVVRARSRLRLLTIASKPIDAETGLLHDRLVRPATHDSHRRYPGRLRSVRYYDAIHDNDLHLLTNSTAIAAITVADLYRLRWQIELFFKWIKQHLRIKVFYGTSPNAVHTQVWIAVIVYLLVAIARKHLNASLPLATTLQILSICLFERMPLKTALTQLPLPQNHEPTHEQLILFDF